ncbi:hypothetical protein P9112_006535 [Eukaryota sp. TZLM1-RC]
MHQTVPPTRQKLRRLQKNFIPCRNIETYGYCRTTSCSFNHDVLTAIRSVPTVLAPRRSQSVPSSPSRSRSTSLDTNVAPFIPKRPSSALPTVEKPPRSTCLSYLSSTVRHFTVPSSLRSALVEQNRQLASSSPPSAVVESLKMFLIPHFGYSHDWAPLPVHLSFPKSPISDSLIYKFICQSNGKPLVCRRFLLSVDTDVDVNLFHQFSFLCSSQQSLLAAPIDCLCHDVDGDTKEVLFIHAYSNGFSLKKMIENKKILLESQIFDIVINLLLACRLVHQKGKSIGLVDSSRILTDGHKVVIHSIGVAEVLGLIQRSDFEQIAFLVIECLGIKFSLEENPLDFLDSIKTKGSVLLANLVTLLMKTGNIDDVLGDPLVKNFLLDFTIKSINQETLLGDYLSVELANIHILQTLTKLNFCVSESQTYCNPQCYVLKLFWDFLFDNPKLDIDWGHVYFNLFKLFHQSKESIFLEDVEHNNSVVVTFKELSKALDSALSEVSSF